MDGINRGRSANICTTQNADASNRWGVEIGYTQPFTFLPGEYLSASGIEATSSCSDSESEGRDVHGNMSPMPSNSEHEANAILWYARAGLSVRAADYCRIKEV